MALEGTIIDYDRNGNAIALSSNNVRRTVLRGTFGNSEYCNGAKVKFEITGIGSMVDFSTNHTLSNGAGDKKVFLSSIPVVTREEIRKVLWQQKVKDITSLVIYDPDERILQQFPAVVVGKNENAMNAAVREIVSLTENGLFASGKLYCGSNSLYGRLIYNTEKNIGGCTDKYSRRNGVLFVPIERIASGLLWNKVEISHSKIADCVECANFN